MIILRKTIIIAFCIFGGMIVCLLFISTNMFPRFGLHAEEGAPNFFINDVAYWSPVSQVVVSYDQIYVLFAHRNIVKVYDLQAEYQYSVYFSETSKSGTSELYIADHHLYFVNRNLPDVYVVKDASCSAYYSAEKGAEIEDWLYDNKKELKKHIDLAGNVYHIDALGNVCVTDVRGDTSIFITRPIWMGIFQNGYLILSYIFLLLCLLIYSRIKKTS